MRVAHRCGGDAENQHFIGDFQFMQRMNVITEAKEFLRKADIPDIVRDLDRIGLTSSVFLGKGITGEEMLERVYGRLPEEDLLALLKYYGKRTSWNN